MSGPTSAMIRALESDPPQDHVDRPRVRRLRASILEDADRYEIVDGVIWDGVDIMDLDRFLQLALPIEVEKIHIRAYWGQYNA